MSHPIRSASFSRAGCGTIESTAGYSCVIQTRELIMKALKIVPFVAILLLGASTGAMAQSAGSSNSSTSGTSTGAGIGASSLSGSNASAVGSGPTGSGIQGSGTSGTVGSSTMGATATPSATAPAGPGTFGPAATSSSGTISGSGTTGSSAGVTGTTPDANASDNDQLLGRQRSAPVGSDASGIAAPPSIMAPPSSSGAR